MSYSLLTRIDSPRVLKTGYPRIGCVHRRCSRLDRQREALIRIGCEKTFEDTASGRITERAGLLDPLDQLRDGDTFVVWKLARLGRRVKQLVDLVSVFKRTGVNFISITGAINTSTRAGHFFFHVMASLAQMERELTVERTRAGLKAARSRAAKAGRKPSMTESKLASAKQLLASGMSPRQEAADLGVSGAILYRTLPARDRT